MRVGKWAMGQEGMIEFLCGDLAPFRAAVLDDKEKI